MAQAMFFGDLMREWWTEGLSLGNARYADESWRRLEREVLPYLADKEPKKITAQMVRKIIQRIEKNGTPAVARKIKSHISQVFKYGIDSGRLFKNPARDVSLKPYKHKPRRAIVDPKMIGSLMRDIVYFRSSKRRHALKLMSLLFVRPGELVQAEWAEIEWESAVWRIPAEKMKMKRPHTVPLPRQALDTLRELYTLTGHLRWLFPSRWDKRKHEQGRVLTYALKKMGYHDVLTAHGFRAMAATALSEQGWASEPIERQLAHVDKNAVRAAYQRSELVAERRKMLQAWADYLDMRCAWAILGK